MIAGSVRKERHGIKVAKWIAKKITRKNREVSVIDPAELDLPLLDKMYKEMENLPEKLVIAEDFV